MIEFAYKYLFILLPLPLLTYYLLPQSKNNNFKITSGIRFPHYNLFINKLDQSNNIKNKYLNLILYFLIWLFLITACAKPLWIGAPLNFLKHGRDLMLAIDISGSMDERDMTGNYRINRLDVVKYIGSEFIEKRVDDRIGVILFGSKAYLYSPLSFDHDMVTKMLQDAQIGFAGTYTAIGDAIGLAIKQFKNLNNQELVLILLSDGGNTSGAVDPISAAKVAKDQGIKIYTIGIGGKSTGVGARQSLDEDTLKEIATITSRQYFRDTDEKSLQQIYATINKLEPLGEDSVVFRPIKDLFYWPLSLALFLSLFLFIKNNIYKHI